MEKRALLVPQEAQLDASPDPYVLTRDVYLQRQDFKAEINNVDEVDEDEEAYLDVCSAILPQLLGWSW